MTGMKLKFNELELKKETSKTKKLIKNRIESVTYGEKFKKTDTFS